MYPPTHFFSVLLKKTAVWKGYITKTLMTFTAPDSQVLATPGVLAAGPLSTPASIAKDVFQPKRVA